MNAIVEAAASWVNDKRGMGWRESHIEQAMAAELRSRGFLVVQQPTVPATIVLSNGVEVPVGSLRPDLLVRTSIDGCDIEQCYIELKLSPTARTNVTQTLIDQTDSYAKQSGIPCIGVYFSSDRTFGTYESLREDLKV